MAIGNGEWEICALVIEIVGWENGASVIAIYEEESVNDA